jgi:hypothetical protein
MGSSDETSDPGIVPIAPRELPGGATAPPSETPVEEPKSPRSFTPLSRDKVVFHHYGEKPVQVKRAYSAKTISHAKRSDQLGLLLGGLALLIIILVGVVLYLNNAKYRLDSASTVKTTAPVIDFYQGNNAYQRKVNQEKSSGSAMDLSVKGANGDLQISLKAQSSSMDEIISKMRAQKKMEEEAQGADAGTGKETSSGGADHPNP